MLITKKESKDLRYFARANYKSAVKGVDTENGKIKHREFPCFGLSYDEAKADKGMVELTNVTIEGKLFEGDYDDLMARLREILDTPEPEPKPRELTDWEKGTLASLEPMGPECRQEPLPKGPSIVQRIKDSDAGKDIVDAAEAITPLFVPGAVAAHTEITDYSPKTETLCVDVDVRVPNTAHEVMLTAEVKPVDGEKTLVVIGSVVPERHDSGRDYSGLSDEAIAEAYKSAVGGVPGSMKPGVEVAVEESLEYLDTHEPPPLVVASLAEPQELPVIENVEEAKMVVEKTGKPVITAEQKRQKSRWELFDLRIKCATMALAKSYGEPPESDIGTIMSRYPDALDKLNALYAKDGIQPYTISEDAIKNAYPDEYAAACS